MGLPFKGSQVEKTVTVKSPCGTSLDIPTTGFASVKEYEEAMKILLSLNNLNGSLNLEKAQSFEKDIVCLMLRHRFKDFKSPESKLLMTEKGDPITAAMLKALFVHFRGELGIQTLELPMGVYSETE